MDYNMKNLLTILFSSLTITALAYAPIECRPTRAECTEIQEKGGKADRDCFVEPQSFCDEILLRYRTKETAKYKVSNDSKNPPADYFFATSTPVAGFYFTRNLGLGMSGSDVRALQQQLNLRGFPLAPTGAGSHGKETTYFGSLTKAAVTRFQKANNLPATGFFGPLTRNKFR